MTGVKRTYDESLILEDRSPILPMFEELRDHLDKHHDSREHVIKASRDIIATSKKITKVLKEIPLEIAQEVRRYRKFLDSKFRSVIPDVRGLNAWRYQPQISSGLQEYVEAVSFEHYLRHQLLIDIKEIQSMLPPGICLTSNDYILGIFDMTGELMRFAVTTIATSGKLPASESSDGIQRDVLVDLRQIRARLEVLDTRSSPESWLEKEINRKLTVMKESVQKVEIAVYGLTVRGQERPTGWLQDDFGDRDLVIEGH